MEDASLETPGRDLGASGSRKGVDESPLSRGEERGEENGWACREEADRQCRGVQEPWLH